ncbi:PIG-L deacetylase family protein [Sphingomonas guangdongensis]|uniref:PIG-L deacetylase family protein n=1 Tax=Sphingomonas guangdongensis TaxID=1141890 RepID=UPI001FE2B61F|nr:PIG-L family deacetylase [Sphingomonas guangdongensis]
MTLRFRRLLVIAPHPDDEAIAAWSLMRRARRCGARVEVVVVSDGGASHPNSRSWPRGRLVVERRLEVRRVLRTIGVGCASVAFLNLPDGALTSHLAVLRRSLARALARSGADVVISPVPHDAHADHRAVAAALAGVRGRGERRMGYSVWPEGAARSLGHLVLPLTSGEVQQKRAAIRRYRTQAGRITDAEAGFAMTHRHLNAFARPTERFARL